jgi:hypothetical protein
MTGRNATKFGRFLSMSSLLIVFVLLLSSSALAQMDLSGMWAPLGYRPDSPDMGDYTGFPLSYEGRLRAEAWAANVFDIAENVCRPYPLEDPFGPAQLRMWTDVDRITQQIVAYHMHFFYHEEERTIWMDGRPHPPDYALHTWAGFSTGEWKGNDLVVTTTHLKENFEWPNGPIRSDRTVVRTHLERYGNYLTAIAFVYDPVNLAEPMVRPQTWAYNPDMAMPPYPCEEATETLVPRGQVPHYLPGKNPMLGYFATKYGIPQEAALGGPETMYPEYIKKLKQMKVPPRKDAALTGASDPNR